MKITSLALRCLCAAGFLAPLQAAPDVDTNAPLLAEDLGISKWVPKPVERKTECLMVTVQVSQAGKEVFHSSRGVFDLKYAADCALITYLPSLLGDSGLLKVSFGRPINAPGRGTAVSPHGLMAASEGTYMPDPRTFVRYMDYGDCRVDYMVEEATLEELKKLAEHPELPNGERPGISQLKEPRAIPPQDQPKKE
ncbi:hypothetical protein [Haloferula sp. BvORR071]|uniref:hypothetical protein n=1 Tax=Haloferula sp. BvORR071 TaxID=1396141 RepID=UPI0005502B5A|nr:hypothetical protein [Haloferula sp. BvORR071]